MIAAAANPKSSRTPNTNAADVPMNAQSSGIKYRYHRRRSAASSMPNVKMVVGHGATPNTGARGY